MGFKILYFMSSKMYPFLILIAQKLGSILPSMPPRVHNLADSVLAFFVTYGSHPTISDSEFS